MRLPPYGNTVIRREIPMCLLVGKTLLNPCLADRKKNNQVSRHAKPKKSTPRTHPLSSLLTLSDLTILVGVLPHNNVVTACSPPTSLEEEAEQQNNKKPKTWSTRSWAIGSKPDGVAPH